MSGIPVTCVSHVPLNARNTSNERIVGVYLVFASLILPAIGSACLNPKNCLAAGYAISFLAVMGGLLVSVLADLAAGPVLVCSYALASFGGVVGKGLKL